jgi:uncharacterized protein YbjT (DUF2867 family)
MKITTAGSVGNVGKPLVKLLVAAGHDVTVITSNSERKSIIEELGAKAAVGSISDPEFLIEAFTGADAVFTMTPPAMGTNIVENIAAAGRAYAKAIQSAGVQRVVMLSSIGADLAAGTGPIQGVHRVEETFKQLQNVQLTILRAGYFFYNFFRDIPLIRNQHVLINNYNGSNKLPFAHPQDIASAIAEELQSSGRGIAVKYIVSDIRTGDEVVAALGEAIGMTDLRWATVSDAELQQGMLAAGLPQELAGLLTEMGQATREGLVTRDFFASGAEVRGRTKLADFAVAFRKKYEEIKL